MFKRIARHLRAAAGIETHLQKALGYQRQMALNAVEAFYLNLRLPHDKIPHCRCLTKKRLIDLYEKNVVYDRATENGCIFYHLERHIWLFIPYVGFDEYIGLCCDVFVDGYSLNITKPFIAIDIGANLFNASLLFAQHPLCKKVFAYEIIPSIYDTGLINLDLNPHLKNKISSFNVGLYNSNGEVEVTYYPTRSGASGISEKLKEAEWFFSTSDQDFLAPDGSQRLSVRVEDACSVIRAHCSAYPEDEVVIKIDAENAEAEILESILPLFDQVYCFVVEVHSRAASNKIASIFKRKKYAQMRHSENVFVFSNQRRVFSARAGHAPGLRPLLQTPLLGLEQIAIEFTELLALA